MSGLTYSFDDEPVRKFCFDSEATRIEVGFSRYFDSVAGEYVESPCSWVVEHWEYARSKLSSQVEFDDLEDHLGIFGLLLSVTMVGQNLEMTVNTIDDHYIDLVFKDPKLTLVVQ